VLAELPVGETDRLGHAHAFTYPPSLAQAVDALAGWPGVTAFVEIKRSSLRRFGREAVLRRVSQVLRPVLDRCVLISFDLPTVKILRLMTGARVGWVLSQYDAEAQAQAAELAPQFLFCNLERLPAEPEPLWPGPWEWALYEVRDLKTARDCHARGARFVETMAVRGLLHAYAESRHQW
jgi:glycerophosphoryl diester phosphodiesterase